MFLTVRPLLWRRREKGEKSISSPTLKLTILRCRLDRIHRSFHEGVSLSILSFFRAGTTNLLWIFWYRISSSSIYQCMFNRSMDKNVRGMLMRVFSLFVPFFSFPFLLAARAIRSYKLQCYSVILAFMANGRWKNKPRLLYVFPGHRVQKWYIRSKCKFTQLAKWEYPPHRQ